MDEKKLYASIRLFDGKAVSGDHELMALIKALEFAVETLNDQLLEMND